MKNNKQTSSACRAMNTVVNTTMLVAGIILLLATESEYGLSNLAGLAMCWFSCHKMKLFYEDNKTE